jgi:hypothetical protein
LGVSQGHGGSRGSSKVAMSSPENSAEGAKGYRASFQSKWLASDGAAGGTRHCLEAIRTWLEIRQMRPSCRGRGFIMKKPFTKIPKFVAYRP